VLLPFVVACERAAPRKVQTPTVGAPETGALQVDAPRLFAEGLAWDPIGARILVGGIVGQQIVATRRDGTSARRFAAPSRGWSVFGLAVDRDRQLVWAACAAVAQGRTLPTDIGRAGLFAFALKDGAQVHERLTPEGDGAQHLFGDLALAPDGRVIATDTLGGGVFAARLDDDALAIVVEPGTFRSPQGVVAIDARTLVVADYSAGLVRVQLDDAGKATATDVIRPPEGEDLRGIDGLAHRGHVLAAVQNGAVPHRILRVELTPAVDAITKVEVLDAIRPPAGEPTLATVVDDTVWVMQTDRWDRVFAQDGRPRDDVTIATPTILRFRFE
jgi:sugar lactone lactonase YvrE